MEEEIRTAVLKEYFGTEDLNWIETEKEICADDLMNCIILASRKTKKFYLNRIYKHMKDISNCDELIYLKKSLCPWTPEGLCVFQAIEDMFKSIFRRDKKKEIDGDSK